MTYYTEAGSKFFFTPGAKGIEFHYNYHCWYIREIPEIILGKRCSIEYYKNIEHPSQTTNILRTSPIIKIRA